MNKQTFDAAVEKLLAEARALIPDETLPDLPYREGIDPGWYDFELKLWAKGEELRQFLSSSRRGLREDQILAVLALCRNVNAKRGRQSFLMLLGRRGYAAHGQAVAALLSDPHLTGHAIDTLYKMGVSGYCREVEPFLDHPMTWVRNSAKRYLLKFS